MANRDRCGDFILTEEEQKELYYRLTHPDAEAIAQRDRILEDLKKMCTIKFNADGSTECFVNSDYANPGPVDDPQWMTSIGAEQIARRWRDTVQDRAQEYTRPLLDILEALGAEITDELRAWASNKVGWISNIDYPDLEDSTSHTLTVTFEALENKE